MASMPQQSRGSERWPVFIPSFLGGGCKSRWDVSCPAKKMDILSNLFVRSFIRLPVRLFICSFVCLFVCLFVCSFVCSFVHSIVHSFVHSFVRSFVRLLVRLLVAMSLERKVNGSFALQFCAHIRESPVLAKKFEAFCATVDGYHSEPLFFLRRTYVRTYVGT